MDTVSRPPRHPALAGVVATLWVSTRRDVDDELVLPTGRAQIVVDGDRGRSLVVGPQTFSSVVRPSAFAAGVSLGGVGLRALSRVPVHEVLDQVVDTADVWDHDPWERCLDAPGPSEILDRLERAALRHLRVGCEVGRDVLLAESAIRGGAQSAAVAAMVGADRRRLVPAFRAAIGLAPKQYQRLVRFQRAVRAMRGSDPEPLAAIAATCGYADQAHLSREFKEFSGLTPGQVHGDASAAHNHVRARSHRRR